jgi:hypothetical protein
MTKSKLTREEALEAARALDPVVLAEHCGIEPDPWQAKALRSTASRLMLLAGRQSGKSTVTSLIALHQALYSPNSLVLLLSPSQRQSGELFRSNVIRYYLNLTHSQPMVSQTQLSAEFANGSRIVSLPADESTVRGYAGVGLLVLDEAARIPDELYFSVLPMLAVSHGRLIALSTPFGQRGWYHQEWLEGKDWERIEAHIEDCPRYTKEKLEQQRQSMGERWYRQEFELSFEGSVDSAFNPSEVRRAFKNTTGALFDRDPIL